MPMSKPEYTKCDGFCWLTRVISIGNYLYDRTREPRPPVSARPHSLPLRSCGLRLQGHTSFVGIISVNFCTHSNAALTMVRSAVLRMDGEREEYTTHLPQEQPKPLAGVGQGGLVKFVTINFPRILPGLVNPLAFNLNIRARFGMSDASRTRTKKHGVGLFVRSGLPPDSPTVTGILVYVLSQVYLNPAAILRLYFLASPPHQVTSPPVCN